MIGAIGVEWRRHIDDVYGGAGSGNAAIVVLAQLKRAQHRKLGLFASGGDLLVVRLGGGRGRKLVGTKRLKFDDIGARARRRLDQRHGAVAIPVVVNPGLGNDRDSTMHGFPSANVRAIEMPSKSGSCLSRVAW